MVVSKWLVVILAVLSSITLTNLILEFFQARYWRTCSNCGELVDIKNDNYCKNCGGEIKHAND